MPRVASKTASYEHLPITEPDMTLVKRRHVCPTCDRTFTTSGHLARHSRVHTGERNHKCPFPGCETRCSRQDNLQQHYRIHLAPGSRRNSKAPTAKTAPVICKRQSISPPPLSSPPALEPARVYPQHSPPPDSPPALVQATLPALVPCIQNESPSLSPTLSRESYSPHILMTLPAMTAIKPANYQYRNGPSTYEEQAEAVKYVPLYSQPGVLQDMSPLSPYPDSPYSECQSGYSPESSRCSAPPSPIPLLQNSQPTISSLYSEYGSAHSREPSPTSSLSVSSQASGVNPSYGVYSDGYTFTAPVMPTDNVVDLHHSPEFTTRPTYPSSDHHYESPTSPLPLLSSFHTMRRISRDARNSPVLHHPQPVMVDIGYRPVLDTWSTEQPVRAIGVMQ